ncbi:SIP domain-containing protein [Salinibacterium sp. ZJ70]|uniref:SIP domain-containing protein n=1 Tax=Salinibacterium sp. ZJ70 TaxID=2708084 RepID=UPI00141FBD8E|nr:SIP domain-containing protein [Salinibacterium sp. ZJ70]
MLVADHAALPAFRRWISEAAAHDAAVLELCSVADEGTRDQFADQPGLDLRWFTGAEREMDRAAGLRELQITATALVLLGGESSDLVPLRRHLRREHALPASQVDAQGYWKWGVANHDHHASLDPSDPDCRGVARYDSYS